MSNDTVIMFGVNKAKCLKLSLNINIQNNNNFINKIRLKMEKIFLNTTGIG